jgi:hypothetical protein
MGDAPFRRTGFWKFRGQSIVSPACRATTPVSARAPPTRDAGHARKGRARLREGQLQRRGDGLFLGPHHASVYWITD